MNYDTATDLEISLAIAGSLKLNESKYEIEKLIGDRLLHEVELGQINYCSDWGRMGPLIEEKGITLIKHIQGYEATVNWLYIDENNQYDTFCNNTTHTDDNWVTAHHTNPLRAAAICYLMIMEGK